MNKGNINGNNFNNMNSFNNEKYQDNNKKKTKNNVVNLKFALPVSILISIVIVFTIGNIGNYMLKRRCKYMNLNSAIAQAHNEPYEMFMGEYVEGTKVKELLTLVNSNNIALKFEENPYLIAIRYGNDEKSAKLMSVEKVLKEITPNTRYKVFYSNEKANDNIPYRLDTNSNSYDLYNFNYIMNTEAFYKNGFIKIITIYENNTGSYDY